MMTVRYGSDSVMILAIKNALNDVYLYFQKKSWSIITGIAIDSGSYIK